jgi:PIN domain nuclease of toxin-antitoxin system
LNELSRDAVTACAAAILPALHKDTFGRVIVAPLKRGALTVLTSDENIAR